MNRKMVEIKELIDEISMGPFGSDIKKENFISHGVPVLNGSNISGTKLKEDFENYLTPQKAESLKKAIAKRGDIIITHRGTLGQIAYIPFNSERENYVISQSQFRVSLKKELINPIYFTYYFHTVEGQKRLLSFKSHVGVPALAQATTNFKLLKFPYISIKEQDKIAKVLSDIDSKIELNNKINAELEAMAKLIYDYWFVQFDFPISETQAQEMNRPDLIGKPYKSSGGKMSYNPQLKREIPVGWEVKSLSEIANITMGQSPSGTSYNESGDGEVFFQGSTDFGWRYPNVRQFTNEPKRIANKGDILLSVRAPVGTLNIADRKCCIGRGLAALNSKDKTNSFLFYVMVYLKQIFDRRNSVGTTFGSITKDDLYSLKTIYPSSKLIKQYDAIVCKYNEKILNNHKQNKDLENLRDWLLPMLMNGQIKIK